MSQDKYVLFVRKNERTPLPEAAESFRFVQSSGIAPEFAAQTSETEKNQEPRESMPRHTLFVILGIITKTS